MTASHDNLAIGIDAGGSKTTAWLGRMDASGDNPVAVGHAGTGNLRAVGFDAATASIREAIDAAFTAAGLPGLPVASVCLSAAGAGRAAEQQELRQWVETQQIAKNVRVTHDAEPVLAAASANEVGIALISGTGSLAWGRNSAGEVRRTGGWGYLFGDEGSGYAISLAGLKAAARAIDGRGEATRLVEAWSQRLRINACTDLIEHIYGSELSRSEIACLAKVVLEVAKEGDAVARQILSDAADQLAEMVTSLASQLQFPTHEFPLGMAGGVLVNQPAFRSAVSELIGVSAGCVTVVPEPVAGALKLAIALVRGAAR